MAPQSLELFAETLDPADWDETRRLDRTMVDDMTDYLSSVGDRPALRVVPAQTKGVAVEGAYFADRGLQLSGSFRALKVWMSLKDQGVARIGRVIQQNIDQARYFAGLVEAADELELAAPVALNIVCFRYAAADTGAQTLDRLNEEILLRIQESGTAVPSKKRLDGKFVIRVCITNHRTRKAHLNRLVADVLRHAHEIRGSA